MQPAAPDLTPERRAALLKARAGLEEALATIAEALGEPVAAARPEPCLVPLKAAAHRIGRSEKTLKRWCELYPRLGGCLPTGRWVIDETELDAFRERRRSRSVTR
jgi:hypothetical protein